MVGDIKATFSQWINHIRDNKGKRPENGQNRRDLGGGEKKSTNFRGGREFFFFSQIQYLMFETTSQAQINTTHTKIFPISPQINLCPGRGIHK